MKYKLTLRSPAPQVRFLLTAASTTVLVTIAGLTLHLTACAPKSPAEAGAPEIQLTHDSGKNFAPRFSPDGEWIVYSAEIPSRKEKYGVFLISPGGGEPRRLQPDTLAMVALGWGKDGRSLFVNAVNEHKLLHVDLNGTILETIDRVPLSQFCDYSPSRGEFLFVRFNGDNRDLGLIRQGDPAPVVLEGTPGWEEDGCFGPGPQEVTSVCRAAYQAPTSFISIWSPETKRFTPVALPEAQNRHPAWSPDGRYMAYSTDRNGPTDIWIFDSITTRYFQVTNVSDEALNAAWSPDGQSLVFSKATRSFHIFLGNPLTGEKRQVTNGSARDVSPVVSPDGKWVAYIRHEPNTPERVSLPAIFVQSTSGDGSDARRLDLTGLILSGQAYGLLQWSPDSREIAYSADDGTGNLNIYRSSIEGGAPVQVTVGAGGKLIPSWSPDGRHIGYTMTAGGETQVYVIPANGGLPRRISRTGNVNEAIVWAPDSDGLAYLSLRPDEVFEIWRTSLSNTEKVARVAESVTPCYPMNWSGDGRSILLGRDRDGQFCACAITLDGKREVELGCEKRDDTVESFFIQLNEAGREHVNALYPGGVAAFADGEQVSEIHVKRVAELIQSNLLAERGN